MQSATRPTTRPATREVTVHNTLPRRDDQGRIVDAHDGCLRHYAGRFWWYGTAYGDTDGFTPANRYVVYSSPDLAAWRLEGDILPERREGVYYRPHVIRRPSDGKYILWYNWYPKLWDGQIGVATADSPAGPFRVEDDNVRVDHQRPGDFDIFVDDQPGADGGGYIIYTSIEGGHAMHVERLTEDLLGSTLEGSGMLDKSVEASTMFRRGEVYYAIFGALCAFCPGGADARVFMAEKPLGPWRAAGNISRYSDGRVIIPAQQTGVARLPSADGEVYLWTGDRWWSRPDGIKGHDFQYWSPPLTFRGDGTIEPLKWVEKWTFRTPG